MRLNWKLQALVTLIGRFLLAAPLSAYISGYLWLGQERITTEGNSTRWYPMLWQAAVYSPLAKVESALRRARVEAGWDYLTPVNK
jgi:hypothetical protein